MRIHQEVTLNSSLEKIYGTLMNATKFSEATGAPAEIVDEEGGAFSCFGGQITGRNIELHKNELIVQAWRIGAWPEGVYSIVRFKLEDVAGKTKVILDHSGFPDDAAEHLETGWAKMYWDPLQNVFA